MYLVASLFVGLVFGEDFAALHKRETIQEKNEMHAATRTGIVYLRLENYILVVYSHEGI